MFVLLALAACGNPCQQLCGEMYDYGKDCGNEPSKEELQLCKDGYAEVDDATAQKCLEASDPEFLREWWTCEDLAENWTDLGG